MSLLHVAIVLPFLCAAIVPLFNKYFHKVHTGWFVLPIPVLLVTYFLQQLSAVSDGEHQQASLPWIPSLDIHFVAYLDGLSLLFSLLITGIGSLVVLYSIFYLSRDKEAIHRFYVYLLLFMGAMLGVVLSDNLIVLYAFWELTSLSSFLLIAFWYKKERSRYGAMKSMLITVFGGFAMLAGFLLLGISSGTFSIREIITMAGDLPEGPLFFPAMLLVLLGAFTKSAQFPFHIWLPDAMEAPTPVSAYLHSATMVKAGLYLVARLTPAFAGEALWFWLVTGFGIVTLIWGSYSAVRQTDLKAILAYSTVSQLGLIMSLLGMGSAAVYFGFSEAGAMQAAAITTAVFHLINHATFKGALFMVAGIVDHETGTRDIRKLGGLMTLMPVTFTLAVVGSFAMAGLPPFNGFLSKEMFFTAVLDTASLSIFELETWGMLLPVIAWVASIFTFVYSMMLVFRTFGGKLQPEKLEKKPHEAPLGLLLPPVVLASLVLVFGLFPNLLSYTLIAPAVLSILPSIADDIEVKISMWHGFNLELFMTIGVIAIGAFLYLMLNKWIGIYRLFPGKYSFNRLYDGLLAMLDRGSLQATTAYMTGSIRHYLIYIFVTMIGLLGYLMLKLQVLQFNTAGYAEVSFYEGALLVVMLAAAVAVPFATSRLAALILVGAVGYLVSLFFVILRAPDLALTQMIVETVSVTLFLLCFYHLPKLKREVSSMPFKLGNLLIALGVGAVVTLLALAASGNKLFPSISDYQLAESYNLGGGNNVVNVILVDIRGFDTLLEIMVLGIASFGIYAMIKQRQDEHNEPLTGRKGRT